LKALFKRHRPSPGFVLGFIALLVALSGTAVGLPGKKSVDKNDLKKNVVTKKTIKNGAVTQAKIANGAVTDSKAADSVFQGATKGSFGSQDRSDGGGPFCDPGGTPTDCVSTNLTLSRNGKVLLNATSEWASILDPGTGQCALRVDGSELAGTSSDWGESTDTTTQDTGNTGAVTALTGVLAKGTHTFALNCVTDGDLFLFDGEITAVQIGTG
jgi:hypothetical protein